MGVKTLQEVANFVPGFQTQRSAETGRYSFASYYLSYLKFQYQLSDQWQFFSRIANAQVETVIYPTAGSNIPQGTPSRGREMEIGAMLKF